MLVSSSKSYWYGKNYCSCDAHYKLSCIPACDFNFIPPALPFYVSNLFSPSQQVDRQNLFLSSRQQLPYQPMEWIKALDYTLKSIWNTIHKQDWSTVHSEHTVRGCLDILLWVFWRIVQQKFCRKKKKKTSLCDVLSHPHPVHIQSKCLPITYTPKTEAHTVCARINMAVQLKGGFVEAAQ